MIDISYIIQYFFKFSNWILSDPLFAGIIGIMLILSKRLARFIGIVILFVIFFSHINIDVSIPIRRDKSSDVYKILERMDQEYDTIKINYTNLSFPVKNFYKYIITTSFGVIDRVHPYRHTGIDVSMPVGTTILAMDDGIVCSSGYGKGRGKYIIIYHPKLKSLCIYYHLSSFTTNKIVKKGEIVGRSGNTGRSTGPHLHWQIEMSDDSRIKVEEKYSIKIKHMGIHINPKDLFRFMN